MISFEDLLGIAGETEPEARIARAVRGLVETTEFRAAAVTYAPGERRPHALVFARGYCAENLAHLRTEFVLHDEQYRAAAEAGEAAMTWDRTGFQHSFTAETWLKPAGYRNGASLAVRDEVYGELGSIHVNTRVESIPSASLRAVHALAAYVAALMQQLRRRDELGLTPRELEVTRLLAQDASNAEIAERLGLSRSTVGTHVESILRKTGSASRVGAAVEAVRLGLA